MMTSDKGISPVWHDAQNAMCDGNAASDRRGNDGNDRWMGLPRGLSLLAEATAKARDALVSPSVKGEDEKEQSASKRAKRRHIVQEGSSQGQVVASEGGEALKSTLKVYFDDGGARLADGRIYVPLSFIQKNFLNAQFPVLIKADIYVNQECIQEAFQVKIAQSQNKSRRHGLGNHWITGHQRLIRDYKDVRLVGLEIMGQERIKLELSASGIWDINSMDPSLALSLGQGPVKDAADNNAGAGVGMLPVAAPSSMTAGVLEATSPSALAGIRGPSSSPGGLPFMGNPLSFGLGGSALPASLPPGASAAGLAATSLPMGSDGTPSSFSFPLPLLAAGGVSPVASALLSKELQLGGVLPTSRPPVLPSLSSMLSNWPLSNPGVKDAIPDAASGPVPEASTPPAEPESTPTDSLSLQQLLKADEGDRNDPNPSTATAAAIGEGSAGPDSCTKDELAARTAPKAALVTNSACLRQRRGETLGNGSDTAGDVATASSSKEPVSTRVTSTSGDATDTIAWTPSSSGGLAKSKSSAPPEAASSAALPSSSSALPQGVLVPTPLLHPAVAMPAPVSSGMMSTSSAASLLALSGLDPSSTAAMASMASQQLASQLNPAAGMNPLETFATGLATSSHLATSLQGMDALSAGLLAATEAPAKPILLNSLNPSSALSLDFPGIAGASAFLGSSRVEACPATSHASPQTTPPSAIGQTSTPQDPVAMAALQQQQLSLASTLPASQQALQLQQQLLQHSQMPLMPGQVESLAMLVQLQQHQQQLAAASLMGLGAGLEPSAALGGAPGASSRAADQGSSGPQQYPRLYDGRIHVPLSLIQTHFAEAEFPVIITARVIVNSVCIGEAISARIVKYKKHKRPTHFNFWITGLQKTLCSYNDLRQAGVNWEHGTHLRIMLLAA